MKVFKPNSLQGKLGSEIYRFRRVFFAVGAFSLVINLLLLVPSLYMLQVYDRVLTSRNETTLLMISLVLAGLLLLEAALEFVRSRVLVRASAALDMNLSSRIFDASFERYLRNGGGSLGQALGDFNGIRQFLTSNGLFAFFDAPWTPIYILVIFLLSPWLGLFAFVAALILLSLAYVTERYTGELLSEAGRAAAGAHAYAINNLRQAETIEAMGMLAHLRERWFQRQTRYLVLQATASDRAASITSMARFFRLFLQSAILGVGALLVIENQLTAGGMIAASILLGRALAPVELGIATWKSFVNARAGYERLTVLLNEYGARPQGISLPRPSGVVSVENLIMGAPGSSEVILKSISFKVPAGSMVAIVGPSASGKSTLARALVGVWGGRSGAVRLDGADVFEWSKGELGPWVGYLPQDVELFEGTIAENIARFGYADSGRIVAAATHAGVHDLVLRLPQGYETIVGPGGSVLSGGQRQRIALARALYGEPAMVVLDEPNANLDDVGEVALMTAINYLRAHKRTVFVVTHRSKVLNAADSAVLLGGGSIEAFGAPDVIRKVIASKAQPGATVIRMQSESAK